MASTSLKEWERDFLRNMQAKLSRFGCNTRLSRKQYRRLMQLAAPDESMARTETPWGRRSLSRRHKRKWRRSIGHAAIILFLIGFVAYKAAERFPEYLGPVATLTATETIIGRVTHVRDGDTIEVSRTPIRFGSLDCAERDTAEGRRATARMRELVVGQTLTCHLNGRTSYDRKIGSCELSDGRDLAAVMIREGYCGRYW